MTGSIHPPCAAASTPCWEDESARRRHLGDRLLEVLIREVACQAREVAGQCEDELRVGSDHALELAPTDVLEDRAGDLVSPAPAPADGAAAKPKSSNPLAEKIGVFVKEYYDASMAVVSALEILLWIRLLLAAVFFQRRSWILIALYTAFLRARFSQSTHVQNSFSQLGARVDSLVGAQGTPPAARQVWDGVKTGARQFTDATDVNKYVGGGAQKKTS